MEISKSLVIFVYNCYNAPLAVTIDVLVNADLKSNDGYLWKSLPKYIAVFEICFEINVKKSQVKW